MIKPDTIDQIFDAARIEEVVGDFVNLKKRGVNMLGLCPFHNERTPSFTVSPAKGIYKCFGCGKGGNAVNFIMDHEHFSYPEALRYLAKKYNIYVEEEKPTEEQQQEIDDKERLFNLTAFAQNHFEETLHQTDEGKSIGLSYFRERGFETETIKKFGLGYSVDKWNVFSSKALNNAYDKELLLKSSLVREKDGQIYDAFRGRITFPIHNISGRVLGFGARILTNDKKKPKYINTAESDIYHKGKVLYGLYFAKNSIVKEDNCLLTEGYTDVISLHQAGIQNVIASSGTSLTTDQIRLVRRYTENMTLLFDGDAAGIKAAFRGIDMILAEGMNVKIVLFPDGEDPDSFARNYRPAEVKDFIDANTADFISFKTRLLLEEAKDDPIKKAKLIKEIGKSIASIPDPITRSLYVQKSSNSLEVEEKLLMHEVNKLRTEIKKQKSKENSGTQTEDSTGEIDRDLLSPQKTQKAFSSAEHEKEIVRILLFYKDQNITFSFEDEDKKMVEEDYRIWDYLIEDIEDDQISFDDEIASRIFREFAQALHDQQQIDEQHFYQHSDPDISKYVIDLISSPYQVSDKWESKHGIFIKKESDDLKKMVLGALYSLKLKKLEMKIYENREKIAKIKEPDEQLNQMSNIKKLDDLKMLLADKLNRIVTN